MGSDSVVKATLTVLGGWITGARVQTEIKCYIMVIKAQRTQSKSPLSHLSIPLTLNMWVFYCTD